VSTDQKSHNDEVDTANDAVDEERDTVTDTDATELDAASPDDAPESTDELDGTELDEASLPTDKPSAKKRRFLSATVGIAALGILLVAAASVTAWLYFAQYRPSQQTGPQAAQTALQAAKDGTVALLSYAPDSLDADLAAAKSHLTGEFLTYYSQFTDQIVRPAAAEKKVQTTAAVVRAAVSDIQPDTATVLVFVNQTTVSAERPDPALANSSVLVNLTKVDGKWLISEFKPV
jgi:Mce-associated membrane protein